MAIRLSASVTKLARAAAVLVGLAFGAFAPAQTVVAPGQSVVATGAAVVTEVNGTVQVRIGNDPPRPLRAGQKVPVGAIVTTGGDATAVLAFADGQVIVLGERTIFRIVSYEFQPKEMAQSGVFLNLIEGSARLVMGSIGQFDPRLIRIQVGTGTLIGAANPEGGNAADAGVVVQGASTMVTVTQGRVVLTLPTGQGIVVASGQGVFVQSNGAVQQGSAAQLLAQVGQTPDGKQIVEQMDTMQSFAFPQRNQQTVITLATPQTTPGTATDTGAEGLVAASIEALPPPGEVLQPLATSTLPTSATGGGGGGTPCGASCN
jgi:hypothetical protein